jgi:arylsulfatase A-like enzyme
MDQHVAFSNRPDTLSLPELDRLRGQALYGTNVYAPADSTPVSMPAFITGKLLSSTKLVNQSKLIITFADSEKSVNWGSQPNLFSKAREAGFNTTLIGWYLPYCSLIGGSLTNCTWMDTESATLAECVSKQITDLACTVPIASKFVVANGLEAKKRHERKKFMESYLGTLKEAEKAVSDPNFGLVLVHWPVPHPPGIYDRRKEEFDIDGKGSYLDNLQLVDQALGTLRRKMEEAGTWDGTSVLLTSDHWWRTGIWRPTDSWTDEDAATVKDETDHRVPFLLKLAGQKDEVTYDPVFNNILLHDLILALLSSELSSPDKVADWLDQHRSIGESPYRFEVPN